MIPLAVNPLDIFPESTGRFFAVLHGTNKEHDARKEEPMISGDASILISLAAVITSLSTLIWSIRRKP